MCYRGSDGRARSLPSGGGNRPSERRALTDGGDPGADESERVPGDEGSEGAAEGEEPEQKSEDETPADVANEGESDSVEASTVDVTDAGEAEPAAPEWEMPDVDDIPEFEIRADEPPAAGSGPAEADSDPGAVSDADRAKSEPPESDPTAGRPHDARAPGATGVSTGGTEAYVAALELCARLPDDVRLPEEAAELVPAAVEAELERDVQSFAAAEFDAPRPHVDALSFEEVDGEIWLRLRIGAPAAAFQDVDPDEIRAYALQQLEDVF